MRYPQNGWDVNSQARKHSLIKHKLSHHHVRVDGQQGLVWAFRIHYGLFLRRRPHSISLRTSTPNNSIPKEDLWPPFTDHLTLAPHPLPNDIFLKKPSLIGLGLGTGPKPREILLHEAHMCEILRRYLHPNIASYLGCVRDEGFVRYKETLSDRLRGRNRPLNLRSCLKGVKSGLDHLHDLGLNHINPANIMLDKEDVPIIIDFDSCQREGDLSFGIGTPGWTNGSVTGISEVYHSAPIRAVWLEYPTELFESVYAVCDSIFHSRLLVLNLQ